MCKNDSNQAFEKQNYSFFYINVGFISIKYGMNLLRTMMLWCSFVHSFLSFKCYFQRNINVEYQLILKMLKYSNLFFIGLFGVMLNN